MRKFSKILESNIYSVSEIKDVFVDLIDLNMEISINHFNGFYDINIVYYDFRNSSVGLKKENLMKIVKILVDCDEKLKSLGLKFVASKEIKLDASDANINLKYKSDGVPPSKDVKNYDEFSTYFDDVYGVWGISSDIGFRLDFATDKGFPNAVSKYHGWEFSPSDNRENIIISSFPGYEEFLKNIMKRKLNWKLLWNREVLPDTDRSSNQLLFNKEGIEIGEKLLQMAKDFPDKIDIQYK